MKTRTLCTWALGLCLSSTASHADEPFSQSFEALLGQHELPGAVVMIKRADRTIHHPACGTAMAQRTKPMQEDAIYRIFSMSKPVAAVALLERVDQGKVALEDDVRAFLPGLRPFERDGNSSPR